MMMASAGAPRSGHGGKKKKKKVRCFWRMLYF
jgi:hypothetical protein